MALLTYQLPMTDQFFVASVFSMQFVQNQFFPSSDRPEILVDLNLPQNASINETRKAVDRLEAIIKDDPDITRWSTYIGQGAIRFYLPLDQQLENPYYAQLVIVSKGLEERGEELRAVLLEVELSKKTRRHCGQTTELEGGAG